MAQNASMINLSRRVFEQKKRKKLNIKELRNFRGKLGIYCLRLDFLPQAKIRPNPNKTF